MNMTHLDEVRAYLQSRGGTYIETDGLDPLITDSKIPRGSFTQAFYKLRTMGEIDTDVVVSEGGRRRVKGIKLIKMASVSTIVKNEAEKQKVKKSNSPTLQTKEQLPHIINYLTKKNAIGEIKAKLEALGFIPEEVTNFPVDPMGEEAIMLLDLVGRARAALSQVTEERDHLMIELEAEKEINRRYTDSKKFTG